MGETLRVSGRATDCPCEIELVDDFPMARRLRHERNGSLRCETGKDKTQRLLIIVPMAMSVVVLMLLEFMPRGLVAVSVAASKAGAPSDVFVFEARL